MKRLLWAIALMLSIALLFSGCVTKKACDRKFPPVDSVREVTVVKTIYRDTTVIIRLPGDTVERVITLQTGPDGLVKSKLSLLQTEFALSKAWVEGGKLNHYLLQKDTAITRLIKNAQSSSVITNNTTATVVKEVNRLSGIQWFQIWCGRILLGVIIVYSVFRLIPYVRTFRPP